MPVGGIDVVPFDITNFGLKTDTKIKLLGMEIDNKLHCLLNVHNRTVDKISNTLRFWSRFYLSLPGRINIVKTFCLSQITYLGCIIRPPEDILKNIADMLEKFVKGNLSISKKRLYDKPANGGLGLIELGPFKSAQQILWMKRTFEACCDNWREDIFNLTYGNPEILDPVLIDKTINPILYNISVSYREFKRYFLEQNNNYTKNALFLNPVVQRSRFDKNSLDRNFFNQLPALEPEKLVNLRFNDVLQRNGPVPIHVLNEINDRNLGLNVNTYMRLVGACLNYVNSRKRAADRNQDLSINIRDYFKSFKKGSSGIRSITCKASAQGSISDLQTVKTFFRITSLQQCESSIIKDMYSLWSIHGVSNKIREFSYKFYNNCLGINTRTSHFVQNQNRACTFCALADQNAEDETFSHLFFSCQRLSGVRDILYTKFFGELGPDPDTKKRFWFGIAPQNVRNKKLLSLSVIIIQFWIWHFKIKKKLPSALILEKNLLFTLGTCFRVDKNLFFMDNSYALSRNWEQICLNGPH
jgi:hypothetical protein